MIVTSIEQCAREVCGRIIYPDTAGNNSYTHNVSKVVMDSRKVRPGSLFIAIRGERSDGHDFVRQIGADGAVAAIVEHAVENADIPQIVVSNTVKALGSLARSNIARRRELAAQGGTPFTVIGITGSVGKTTTKDIAYSLLSSAGPTVAPQGSFNNEIGLPYTALEVDRDTRFLIAEMGASALGEIAYLTHIVPPDIAVELKVGVAHLGGFGSVDNIRKAKSELVQALSADGTAILNADDDNIRLMAGSAASGTIIWFGIKDGDHSFPDAGSSGSGGKKAAAVYADNISVDHYDRPVFDLHLPDSRPYTVRLGIPGEHNIYNALAASCVAYRVGIPVQEIARILGGQVLRSPHRMSISEINAGSPDISGSRNTQFTLIDDSFNANPDSMEAGLNGLAQWNRDADAAAQPYRVAVLGPMLELGPGEEGLHKDIGRYAAEHADAIVAVGNERDPALDALAHYLADGAAQGYHGKEGQVSAPVYWAESAADAAQLVSSLAASHPHTVVLLKGSHASGLQGLADMWTAQGRNK